MKNKRQLQSLESLAQSKENRWQRHVSIQFRALQAEEQRLAQLNQYVNEYQLADSETGTSQSMLTLRTQRQFVNRLHHAVQQQQQTVINKRSAANRDADFWREARSKRLAIQKYADKQEQVEYKLKARRTQKFLDEVGRGVSSRRDVK